MNYITSRTSCTLPRRGTTTVEFSIILPLFFLVLIGGMQIFRYTVVANTVETAVIEAARQGMISVKSDSTIEAVAKDVLDQAGLTGYTIDVNGYFGCGHRKIRHHSATSRA